MSCLLGLALGLHPQVGIPAVKPVAELGACAVLLPVPWFMEDRHGSALAPGPDTVSDQTLVGVIDEAKALGLDVVLLPFVRLRQGAPHDWRGVIRPGDRRAWWRSYRRFILHYAAIAEAAEAPILVIGSELTSMSEDRSDWRSLAADVRGRYRGRLAYVANHDALDRRGPFAFVDVVGVSAYFPLTTTNLDASPSELGAAWSEIVARLARLRAEVKRPILLFEVGYPSIDGGAATAPWDYLVGAPIDLVEQARAYRAATSAILAGPPLEGVFFWEWTAGMGGPHDRGYTVRNKPAEAVVRDFFRRASHQP